LKCPHGCKATGNIVAFYVVMLRIWEVLDVVGVELNSVRK
jgi:hypothetical protein